MSGRLYVVATPIGNLEDLTVRARRVLQEVSLVICEDTRRTQGLLHHVEARPETQSLPAFDEVARAEALAARIAGGVTAALVTDAGTPAISDPGAALVSAVVRAGGEVVPVPGPTAATAALSAAGFVSGRYHFLGFLPRTQVDAAAMLDEVRSLRASLVLYEAPSRLAETLKLLAASLGDRRAVVGRELTKLHEEIVRGTLAELSHRWPEPPLGELVIVVEGATTERWTESDVAAALNAGIARGERLKDLSNDVARRSGWVSRDVYALGVRLKC